MKKQDSAVAFFGFGLIFIAPFLLFNPDMTLLDVLPDCIGYLMLVLSLRKLRDLNSYFEAAASGFFKAMILSAVKLLSFFIILVLCDEMNRKTWFLLLLFGFGIGEVLLLLPAWKAFFEGWNFCGFTYPEKKKKNKVDLMRGATLRFLLEKEIITILPEISVLSEHDYIDRGMRWFEYTVLFRTLAMMLLAACGVVWLVRMVLFLRETVAQTDVFAALEADYRARVVKKTGVFEMRRISLTLLLGAAGCIAACDLTVDGTNFLPDILAAVLFLLFFVFSRYSGKLRTPGIVVSAVYVPLTLFGDIAEGEFSSKSSIALVRTEPEAWNAFWKYYPVRVAEAVVLSVLTVFALLTICRIIRDHCGYVPDEINDHYRQSKLAEIRHMLHIKLGFCIAFSALARLADAACDYLMTFPSFLGQSAELLTFALGVLSAVFWLRLTFGVYDNAKLRYLTN